MEGGHLQRHTAVLEDRDVTSGSGGELGTCWGKLVCLAEEVGLSSGLVESSNIGELLGNTDAGACPIPPRLMSWSKHSICAFNPTNEQPALETPAVDGRGPQSPSSLLFTALFQSPRQHLYRYFLFMAE